MGWRLGLAAEGGAGCRAWVCLGSLLSYQGQEKEEEQRWRWIRLAGSRGDGQGRTDGAAILVQDGLQTTK